jgi:small neutral amino acid transporter SnatA (MarC family)
VLELVFNSFVTLLVVVDPLGLAPIFAALTRGYPEKRKREAAIRGTILGAVILLIFALVGDALLGALGIGLPAFRTAGGVLLVVLLITLVALLLSPRIMRLFGETGANVLSRVLGVLLAALAVQFFFDGLESILS